jgi:gliding motility-associated-like protein
MAGVYKVTVTSTQGCTAFNTLDVDVNENPVAFAGADQDLKFFFETEMSADLSASETGKWTLVSGSARITDIHSPVTGLTELGLGKNVFTWEVISGTCKASDDVIIYVEDLFIPSVITPNGDGKNEFFIINSLTVPGAKRADLIILNKWGSVEYRNKNYVNDWDGKNDRGDDLENDTYMYILRFENGFTRKGTVLIAR